MAKGRRSSSGKNQRKNAARNRQQPRLSRPNAPGDGRTAEAPAPGNEAPRKSVAAAEGTAVVTAPLPEAEAEARAEARAVEEAPPAQPAAPPVEEAPPVSPAPAVSPAAPAQPAGAAPEDRQTTRTTTRSGAPVPPRLLPPLASGPVRPRPELQPPYPRPDRSRRQRIMTVGGPLLLGVGVLVIVGAVIGLLVSTGGGASHPKRSPIAAYLTAHVPAGTRVASFGPVSYSLPAAYPTVPIDASDLAASAGLRFGVAPDPLISAGPTVTSYVLGHASLVAVDHGHASLWAMGTKGSPPVSTPAKAAPPRPAPAATPASPASAATTPPAPAATPASPAPAATPTPAPAATPASPAPAATPTPALAATPPPASAPQPPATSTPAATPAAHTPTPSGAATTFTIQSGQNFWSIAQQVTHQRLGTTPTNAQVAQYWSALMAANANHLPVPGNANLIYSGTTLVLPAG